MSGQAPERNGENLFVDEGVLGTACTSLLLTAANKASSWSRLHCQRFPKIPRRSPASKSYTHPTFPSDAKPDLHRPSILILQTTAGANGIHYFRRMDRGEENLAQTCSPSWSGITCLVRYDTCLVMSPSFEYTAKHASDMGIFLRKRSCGLFGHDPYISMNSPWSLLPAELSWYVIFMTDCGKRASTAEST